MSRVANVKTVHSCGLLKSVLITIVANSTTLLRIVLSFHRYSPRFYHCVSVGRDSIRIDIFLQISQCDHAIVFQFQVLHISLKVLLVAAHPIVSRIRNAVKLQNCNATIACLPDRTNEVRK